MKRHLEWTREAGLSMLPCRSDVWPLARWSADALGAAFLNAYRDTIDYEGESIDDAVGEVRNVLSGGYGALDTDLSGAVEQDGRPVSMVFATRDEARRIFIAYVATVPWAAGRGLARGLVHRCCALAEPGARVHLYVTAGNRRAEQLYESLGFREVRP